MKFHNEPARKNQRPARPLPPIVTLEELGEQLRQQYGPTMRPRPRRKKAKEAELERTN